MACGVKERGALLRWRGITAVSRGGKRDREANVLDNNACFRYEKASAPTFPDMKKGARRAAEPAERGSKRSVRLHSSRAKLIKRHDGLIAGHPSASAEPERRAASGANVVKIKSKRRRQFGNPTTLIRPVQRRTMRVPWRRRWSVRRGGRRGPLRGPWKRRRTSRPTCSVCQDSAEKSCAVCSAREGGTVDAWIFFPRNEPCHEHTNANFPVYGGVNSRFLDFQYMGELIQGFLIQ